MKYWFKKQFASVLYSIAITITLMFQLCIRFCLYPQEIVLQLEQTVRVRMIQLLSHHTMVPTKIEFFTGTKYRPTHHSTFTRLGYVSFSDNKATGYKVSILYCLQGLQLFIMYIVLYIMFFFFFLSRKENLSQSMLTAMVLL